MELTADGLDEHVAAIAQLLERYGVALDLGAVGELVVDQTPGGSAFFELRGFLPDGRQPARSVIEVREVWRRRSADALERWEYEYELLDHERGFRRAFHLHDRDEFIRRHQVVVHEHCEYPIGVAPCAHFEGGPVRDAFEGVERLLAAWTDPTVPDCMRLRCLES